MFRKILLAALALCLCMTAPAAKKKNGRKASFPLSLIHI